MFDWKRENRRVINGLPLEGHSRVSNSGSRLIITVADIERCQLYRSKNRIIRSAKLGISQYKNYAPLDYFHPTKKKMGTIPSRETPNSSARSLVERGGRGALLSGGGTRKINLFLTSSLINIH